MVVSCFSGAPLCDRMGRNPPDSSVNGIFPARILEWVGMPSSGNPPDPGIKPTSPALRADFFTATQRRGPFLHLLRVWRIVGRGLNPRRRGHRQGWFLEVVIEFRRSQRLGLRGTISHPQSGAASKSVPGKPHPLQVSTFPSTSPSLQPPDASLAATVELILYDPELCEEASYPWKL